jgi:hypothetical protein
MNARQIEELAAILVVQYGRWALSHARGRRAQHAREPLSEAFQIWNAITAATARILRSQAPARARIRRGRAG